MKRISRELAQEITDYLDSLPPMHVSSYRTPEEYEQAKALRQRNARRIREAIGLTTEDVLLNGARIVLDSGD